MAGFRGKVDGNEQQLVFQVQGYMKNCFVVSNDEYGVLKKEGSHLDQRFVGGRVKGCFIESSKRFPSHLRSCQAV